MALDALTNSFVQGSSLGQRDEAAPTPLIYRPSEETLESSRQQDRKEALERVIPTTITRSPTTYRV